MKVYTETEAEQRLAELLDKAERQGEILIRRQDGRMYVVKPVSRKTSPLDVETVDIRLTRDEIVRYVREGRESGVERH